MGSNEPLATTAYFWPVVKGGTLPAFSNVKKLGRAKKSRSFDVPDWAFSSVGLTEAGAGLTGDAGSVGELG